MKRDELAARVITLLDRNSGSVILIKGAWGTGKTYFWRNSIEKKLTSDESRKSAYVTLFGKKDINSIQEDILAQLFSRNKNIQKVKDAIGSLKTVFGGKDDGDGAFNFGISGSVLNVVLSLLEKNTFKGITLCIDDFERKDDGLRCVEIMGYASILSEMYGCNVLLLMDEEKIGKDERSVYDQYKEKLLDHEIEFDVDSDEVISEIVFNLDESGQRKVREVISIAQEKNLRVIKKAVDVIVRVKNAISQAVDGETSDYLVSHIVALVCIYHALGSDGMERLNRFPQFKSKDQASASDERAGVYYSRLAYLVYGHAEIDVWLWKHITGQICDPEDLNSTLNKYSKDLVARSLDSAVFGLLDKYLYKVDMTSKGFEQEMIDLLHTAPRNIITIVNYRNFRFLISSMQEISGRGDYWKEYESAQFVEYVREFFALYNSIEKYSSAIDHSNIHVICGVCAKASAEHDRLLSLLTEAAQTHDEINELMKAILRKSGWNRHDVLCLNEVREDFIIEWITKSPVFFETLVHFLRWLGDHADSPFKAFRESCFAAFESLGEQRLGKFRFRRALAIAKNQLGDSAKES
jgi:hypothetical protein